MIPRFIKFLSNKYLFRLCFLDSIVRCADDNKTAKKSGYPEIRYTYRQGWAQDLLGRDRDQDRDLSSRDRDETETFAKLSETRPRRDPRVSETRPRRDLFVVETISRHMAYKCMVYALHTVPKKNPLD